MNSKPDYVIFIGFGNPLCADDGAGPQAARELRRWGLNAMAVQQLTPELAESIAGAELAVFIDADAELEPGEVRMRDIAASPDDVLEHHVSPGTLLRLARDVYGHAPHAVLIGIGGERFDLHEGLSEAALRGIEEVVELCIMPG